MIRKSFLPNIVSKVYQFIVIVKRINMVLGFFRTIYFGIKKQNKTKLM